MSNARPRSHAVDIRADQMQAPELKPVSFSNAIYSFTMGGAIADGLFIIKVPMEADVINHVLFGAAVGACPGALMGMTFDMAIANYSGRQSFSSSCKGALTAILVAPLAGAFVNAAEIVAVRLGCPEEQAKYFAPAAIMATANMLYFGPTIAKKAASSIKNCASSFCAFFKNKNNVSQPSNSTPLLTPAPVARLGGSTGT